MKNLNKTLDLEDKFKKYSKLNNIELYKEFNSSDKGISIIELEDRLDYYGKNSIEIKNENTWVRKIKEAVINPFNIVLILVAIVTFITDIVIPKNKDFATFILIVSTVIISAIISLVQQTKSDKAAIKLKSMITNKIDVIRDGVISIEEVENIVPGDILKLS